MKVLLAALVIVALLGALQLRPRDAAGPTPQQSQAVDAARQAAQQASQPPPQGP